MTKRFNEIVPFANHVSITTASAPLGAKSTVSKFPCSEAFVSSGMMLARDCCYISVTYAMSITA